MKTIKDRKILDLEKKVQDLENEMNVVVKWLFKLDGKAGNHEKVINDLLSDIDLAKSIKDIVENDDYGLEARVSRLENNQQPLNVMSRTIVSTSTNNTSKVSLQKQFDL